MVFCRVAVRKAVTTVAFDQGHDVDEVGCFGGAGNKNLKRGISRSFTPARRNCSDLGKVPWDTTELLHCLLQGALKDAAGARVVLVEREVFRLLLEPAASLSRRETLHAERPASSSWERWRTCLIWSPGGTGSVLVEMWLADT